MVLGKTNFGCQTDWVEWFTPYLPTPSRKWKLFSHNWNNMKTSHGQLQLPISQEWFPSSDIGNYSPTTGFYWIVEKVYNYFKTYARSHSYKLPNTVNTLQQKVSSVWETGEAVNTCGNRVSWIIIYLFGARFQFRSLQHLRHFVTRWIAYVNAVPRLQSTKPRLVPGRLCSFQRVFMVEKLLAFDKI